MCIFVRTSQHVSCGATSTTARSSVHVQPGGHGDKNGKNVDNGKNGENGDGDRSVVVIGFC